MNWKQSATAEDGAQWHESRCIFVTRTLKNCKIRLTSLPEKRQGARAKGTSDWRAEKNCRSVTKAKVVGEAESKAGQGPVGAEREGMAGAWTEVWIMQPVRNLREKGGSAALVGSANVAGWLRGSRVLGDSYGTQNSKRLENTMETLEVLTVNAPGLRAFRARNGSIGYQESGMQLLTALATRAIDRREDAFFLNSIWHTDKSSQAKVVMMSDAGIRDSPTRRVVKQQGMGFLMMHRSTREPLAAASFFVVTRAKQDDINILGLRAVQAAAGMVIAVRAGEAGQFTRTRASAFTRSALRTLKANVAVCRHSWEEGNR